MRRSIFCNVVSKHSIVDGVGWGGIPLKPKPKGLGAVTSQFWANVYLHPLDLFIKQELRCGAYLRYCDDLLLFADDKPTLHGWRTQIATELARLRLTFHANRAQVVSSTAGFPWLGWTLTPNRRRLRRRSVVNFWRVYRRRLAQYAAGELPLDGVKATMNGFNGWTKHGDTFMLRRKIFGLRVRAPRHKG